ncbi:MAG: EAL domain-containing protein [Gammaproteobacteria bacterium]|nr:EAL domain-containing protein [Gammaproteobacteria bacterium]
MLWLHASALAERLDERMAMHGQNISRMLEAPIVFDDPQGASEVLSSLKLDPAIELALVVRNDGSTFAAHSGRDSRSSLHQLLIPLAYDNSLRLQLYFNRNEVHSGTYKLMTQALAISVLVIIGALLITWSQQRRIAKPIQALAKLAAAVTESGDYEQQADGQRRDEFGQLGRAFNLLLATVAEKERQLESQVQKRTQVLERLVREFRHRAYHDALTKLGNGEYLRENFLTLIGNKPAALVLIDLDNFKTINDTLGHDFGDQVLVRVSERLVSQFPQPRRVFRLGGDEFVVMMQPVTDLYSLQQQCSSLLNLLQQPITIGGRAIRIKASAGVVRIPADGQSHCDVKSHADLAMYAAKDSGRNRFRLFEPSMREQAQHRLMVQSELEQALQNQEIELYFQPKVDASNFSLHSCEVLCRWRHPSLGLLTPDRFIATAEDCGLVQAIDYHVINMACSTLQRWHQNGQALLHLSVNLSGLHFCDHQVVAHLDQCLQRHQIPGAWLGVEITEAALIRDTRKALDIVHAIRALGVSISLDDFGTGYASLGYLRVLPVDVVKLDRSFVQGLEHNIIDRKVISHVVALAKDLGAELVAEGVEDENQISLLQSLGCHYLQGYYFSRPLPETQFIAWRQANLQPQLSV